MLVYYSTRKLFFLNRALVWTCFTILLLSLHLYRPLFQVLLFCASLIHKVFPKNLSLHRVAFSNASSLGFFPGVSLVYRHFLFQEDFLVDSFCRPCKRDVERERDKEWAMQSWREREIWENVGQERERGIERHTKSPESQFKGCSPQKRLTLGKMF